MSTTEPIGTVATSTEKVIVQRQGEQLTLAQGDAILAGDVIKNTDTSPVDISLKAMTPEQADSLVTMAPGAAAQVTIASGAEGAPIFEVTALSEGVELFAVGDGGNGAVMMTDSGGFTGLFGAGLLGAATLGSASTAAAVIGGGLAVASVVSSDGDTTTASTTTTSTGTTTGTDTGTGTGSGTDTGSGTGTGTDSGSGSGSGSDSGSGTDTGGTDGGTDSGGSTSPLAPLIDALAGTPLAPIGDVLAMLPLDSLPISSLPSLPSDSALPTGLPTGL